MSSQTAVAKDPQTRRVACETIFECDIFLALNEIIYNGETSRIRWQAAVLMKLLAMYGPTKHVCSAMKAKGCLDALMALKDVQHCKEVSLSRLSTCIAVILCYISCNFVSSFGA